MLKRRIASVLLILLLIIGIAGCGDFGNQQDATKSNGYERPTVTDVRVHVIDVGQGDSIFIETPSTCILIDAGISDAAKTVEDYLHGLGYGEIDILIATHPHADHIGGMAHIIKNFDIDKFYMPKVSHNTKTFEGMLRAAESKGLKVHTAKAGVNLITEEKLSADMLSPINISYKDLNNFSTVVMLTYGDTKFLFMGDAEAQVEEMLGDVSADVLKVGHHGSSTSSRKAFLERVSPKYAAISAGKNNSYGHPHKETIENLKQVGAEIYITYEAGNIVFISDGKEIEVKTGNE